MKSDPTRIHPELRWSIEEVATKCRRARLLRCCARFGLATLGLTVFATGFLALLSPDGPGATVLLAAYLVAAAVAFGMLIVRPLRTRITLRQVALYIDEHHPELENRIVSAIEFSLDEESKASPWMIEQFIQETVPIVRNTSFSDVLSATVTLRFGAAVMVLLAISAGVVIAFNQLWIPTVTFILPERFSQSATLPFTVEPGDVRVRKGDNQMIWVRSDDATRAVQLRYRVGNGVWETVDAGRSNSETVFYHQFTNVQKDILYQVQFGRRRSQQFLITAWTPPEIESIDLTYHYPDYLQQGPKEIPNSGNITAIEGTVVDVGVWVNKRLARAELVLESGERFAMTQKADTFWTADITLLKNDRYWVELVDREDAPSEYDHEYKIIALRDHAPEIRIEFPRGDSEVSAIDEVPFDFEVTDDFGFSEFGIQYEIAGREPVRIPLHDGRGLIAKAEGHHEIMLEDLDLESGDFITWTVWAKDTKPDRDEFEIMGDPYFLEIRPFVRRYREAVSGAGGGGGGMQQDDLAQGQKDVLIATWNLRRDARYMDLEEYNEKRNIIVETQDGLLNQVSQAAGMMGQSKPQIRALLDAMNRSLDALTRSQLPDPKPELSEATAAQQRANRLILKLEGNESEVRQQQGGGGGGGGDQRPDISELEMARNRNFYEQENLTREQQEATDEVLKKIKELAQRQQSISEELAKLISEMQQAETEKEKERIARKLERLREEIEKNLERLDEARQDLGSEKLNSGQTREARESLDRARHQMNRTLEQLEREELQKARTASARAIAALEEMEEQLQQFSRRAAAQRMRQLQEQMERLEEQQGEIAEQARKALEQHESPSLDQQRELEETKDELQARKTDLAEDFVEMMGDASELAERAQQTQELMARELGDWLRQTSREGILEDIEESQPLVEYGIWDSVQREEAKIGRKLGEAAEKLARVADSLVEDELEGMQKALEQLDRLLQDEAVAEALREDSEEEAEQSGGREPGEQAGAGEQEGEEPGRGPGEGEEERMARGEGEQPGEGASESRESGSQPSEEGAQGKGQQGEASSENGDSNRPGGSPGDPNQDAGQGGSFDARTAMRNFAQRGYQNWTNRLRDAESLLPYDSPIRQELLGIREEIGTVRREWRERKRAPQFDLFLKIAARPLADAAEKLQREIERKLDKKEFIIADDGDIPERYKKRVADYFKNLSEAEQKQ